MILLSRASWRNFLRFLLFQDEADTMHPLFAKTDRLSGEVIGAAIEGHRITAPGLLESTYERCLARGLLPGANHA